MRKKRRMEAVTVVLLIVAVLLLAGIVAGTLWAFAGGHVRIREDGGRSLFSLRSRDPAADDVVRGDASGNTAVFTELGTLRAKTADEHTATVVVSVYFPYPANDLAFEEEITGKSRSIRRVVLEWFATRTLEEIDSMGEQGVKKALLGEINGLFVLGRIETLYFGDYMVFE